MKAAEVVSFSVAMLVEGKVSAEDARVAALAFG
jgi:hypothetical protein